MRPGTRQRIRPRRLPMRLSRRAIRPARAASLLQHGAPSGRSRLSNLNSRRSAGVSVLRRVASRRAGFAPMKLSEGRSTDALDAIERRYPTDEVRALVAEIQRLNTIAERANDLVRALQPARLTTTPKLLVVALAERLETPATGRGKKRLGRTALLAGVIVVPVWPAGSPARRRAGEQKVRRTAAPRRRSASCAPAYRDRVVAVGVIFGAIIALMFGAMVGRGAAPCIDRTLARWLLAQLRPLVFTEERIGKAAGIYRVNTPACEAAICEIRLAALPACRWRPMSPSLLQPPLVVFGRDSRGLAPISHVSSSYEQV